MYNKKIALLIYPEFSFQEIGNLSALFRWYFDTMTVTFSTTKAPIKSEEGFVILPEKTVDEFVLEEYDFLVLSGCSNLTGPLKDDKLISFLSSFKDNDDFVIGAICSAPVLLAKSGLLSGKKFINSMYYEMNVRFGFIEEKNIVYKPIVEDGNIITAVGGAYRQFAVQMAKKIGYECPDTAFEGIGNDYNEEELIYHLSESDLEFFEKEYKDFF